MPQRSWQCEHYGHHEGEIVAVSGDYDVIECRICGFRHIVPLPAPEKQKAFYEEEFYQAEKAQYLNEADEDFDWKRAELKLRFSIADQLLKAGKKRLLDIGSGPGDFLAVGQALGWETIGVEPSRVACEHARSRGVEVRHGFFDAEMANELGAFDFIHMSEVLEHVAEPKKLLALAVSLLKPGGVICVSTPNDFNPMQKTVVDRFAKDNWWVVPDHHLNYFNFDSLTDLITSAGCEVKQRLTNFPMELFLLMGQDYTSQQELGRQLHGWRKSLDLNLASMEDGTMRGFYEGLANAGFGRLAIIFAQKPGKR